MKDFTAADVEKFLRLLPEPYLTANVEDARSGMLMPPVNENCVWVSEEGLM